MTDFLFILNFVLVPVLIITTTKAAGINIRYLSIPALYVTYYITFAYLGVIALYFGWDKIALAYGIDDKNLVLNVFMYSASSILLTTTSFAICRRYLGPINSSGHRVVLQLSNIQYYLVGALVFLCFAVLLLYIKKLEALPITAIIEGNPFKARALRSAAGNAFKGSYHRYGIFIDELLPFITFILYANKITKKNTSSNYMFFLCFAICCFASVMLTIKSKIVFLFIGLIITKHYTNRTPVSTKKLVNVTVLSMAVLTSMFYFFMGTGDFLILDVWAGIFHRITTGQILPAYFYLEMFPRHTDFLLGRSFPNPGGLLPFNNFPLTVEVMNYIIPHLAQSEAVGSAPTTYWGELYANFGPVAPFLFAPFLGVFLYVIQLLISRLPINPITIGFSAWAGIHFMKLATRGISNYVPDIPLHLIIIITLCLLSLQNNRRPILYQVQQGTLLPKVKQEK